ncbi:replication protein A 70 kDa DNA-binding subunit B [Trifolium repens]|nr:replication protein A 70 kDa DNA-binding subunit B [Trifolium repens]
MARPLETIKDINDSKYLWKVAVLVKDLWVVNNAKNKQHVEMVLTDKLGHDIQVIVPADLKDQFQNVLAENTTFSVQNFSVETNNISLKCSAHPFKLVFSSCTLIQDINEYNIPHPGFKFQDFNDIKQGNVRPDVVVDVIGVFHELGYTQTEPGPRKIQINFKLKDLKGNILNCTLWEDFAVQFQNYNKNRSEWGSTIIIIHNGKINQATDRYELGVSNAWNATKLYINDDIAAINEFRASLGVEEGNSSQSQSLTNLTSGSIMLSQSSSMSQYNAVDKFMDKAIPLPLNKILALSENTICVTVARTTKVIPTTKGWYYKACSKCIKSAKGDTLPLICPDGHATHAINLRFKLEFEAEYQGTSAKFVFWDRECNQLLGKTAAELHAEMTALGVTNPLEYPLCVDKICGRNFAIRTKWQPVWDSCSVQALKEDDAIINKIKELFPNDEETSKMVILDSETPAATQESIQLKEIVIVDITKDDVLFHSDLSATSENDPCQPKQVTPSKGKRSAADSAQTQDNVLIDAPTQLSSTKLKRAIKVEKKT